MTFTQQRAPEVHPANLTKTMVYVYSLGGWAEYHDVVRYMLVEMYHHSPMEMTWDGGYGVIAHRMCKAGLVRILHTSSAATPERYMRVRIGLTAKGREEAQIETANRLFRGERELRKVQTNYSRNGGEPSVTDEGVIF